jgi:hypothetical protein
MNTDQRHKPHEGEAWMILPSARGGYFCAACGARTTADGFELVGQHA